MTKRLLCGRIVSTKIIKREGHATMKKRLEQIDNQLFYLDMKDHWNNADYELDRKLRQEKREIMKILGGE